MNLPTKFMFPNSGTAVITEYVPCLSILLNALQPNHQPCNLYFNPDFLVLNSYIDMIIGIAFLRYHRIMTYFVLRHIDIYYNYRPYNYYSTPCIQLCSSMYYEVLSFCYTKRPMSSSSPTITFYPSTTTFSC